MAMPSPLKGSAASPARRRRAGTPRRSGPRQGCPRGVVAGAAVATEDLDSLPPVVLGLGDGDPQAVSALVPPSPATTNSSRVSGRKVVGEDRPASGLTVRMSTVAP